jgi:hypothetical protein
VEEGAEFVDGVKYKWVRAERALLGWANGVVDVYNASVIDGTAKPAGSQRGKASHLVGVMFRDMSVVEPGVYRLVALGIRPCF